MSGLNCRSVGRLQRFGSGTGTGRALVKILPFGTAAPGSTGLPLPVLKAAFQSAMSLVIAIPSVVQLPPQWESLVFKTNLEAVISAKLTKFIAVVYDEPKS